MIDPTHIDERRQATGHNSEYMRYFITETRKADNVKLRVRLEDLFFVGAAVGSSGRAV